MYPMTTTNTSYEKERLENCSRQKLLITEGAAYFQSSWASFQKDLPCVLSVTLVLSSHFFSELVANLLLRDGVRLNLIPLDKSPLTSCLINPWQSLILFLHSCTIEVLSVCHLEVVQTPPYITYFHAWKPKPSTRTRKTRNLRLHLGSVYTNPNSVEKIPKQVGFGCCLHKCNETGYLEQS